MESLDVSAPLFSVAEVVEVSGVSRSNVDVLVSLNLVRPTRRVKAARPSGAKSRGRPMFSVRAIFVVRLIRELHSLRLSYADSAALADQVEKAKIPQSEITKNSNKYLTSFEVVDGDWIAACAKSPSPSTDQVYAHVSCIGGKWTVDIRLAASEAGVRLSPQIIIPVSDIFFVVYAACSKLLGITIARNDPLKGAYNDPLKGPLDQIGGASNFTKPPKKRPLSN